MRPIDIAEMQDALAAARLAGNYIRAEYERFTPIPNAPANISTEVDRGSQELILKYLKERYPNDGLCGEESTATPLGPGTTGRVWVVDPIDGTRGFAKKNGEFSVMIGLTVNGESTLGVVLEPVTDTVTFAAKGQGCWLQIAGGEPRRCRVKSESNIRNCILVQSHSRPGKVSAPVAALQPGSIREMYSAGVKMAVVARGEADVYVNTYSNFSDWDICAGHILVTEAGGIVSGLGGETITYGGPQYKQPFGLIAASTAVYGSLVSQLAGMTWP